MACSPTRGKFLPQPVETTTRTSRRRNRGESEATAQLADRLYDRKPSPLSTSERISIEPVKPASIMRHFIPQPIETSSRSSRFTNSQKKEEDYRNGNRQLRETSHVASGEQFTHDVHQSIYKTASPDGRLALEHHAGKPQPVRRRFGPEPTETTSKSSRHQQAKDNDQAEPPWARRRLVPESILSSGNNTRKKEAEAPAGYQSRATRGKIVPAPIETTTRHGRNQTVEEDPDPPSLDLKTQTHHSNGVSRPRKFSPELIETASGSFKKADRLSRLSSSRTSTHPTGIPRYLQTPPVPNNSPCPGPEELPQIHESRFSAASLARRQTRQHSFLVPELPSIESDSSGENSAIPSLSTSPSMSSAESTDRPRKEGIPGCPDPDIQGYMLSLAASAAERQLRDQAMAAYANEQVHEPVQHFAAEDTDEESLSGRLKVNNGIDPGTFRRESNLDWHMNEMRRHHAQLEDAGRALGEDNPGQSRFASKALLGRDQAHVNKMAGRNQQEVGLADTRNAVSPPMLGGDLVFAMSVSPKTTRCDVDQIPVPRKHEDVESDNDTGGQELWSAAAMVSNNPDAGLWMGLCQKKEGNEQSLPTPKRTGLLTPAVESDHDDRAAGLNHGQGLIQQSHNLLPLSAPPCITHIKDLSMASFNIKLNQELSIEQQIEEEFDDGFVTQIYNYLSLGYPSLAHKFDDELSKISRIPVHELRRDDELADAKGYVGAPEGNGLDEFSARAGKCARWTALRLYIHEWARQQPVMADPRPNDWGFRVRRGSWAV